MITVEYAAERERMVKDQLEKKGIRNPRVLDAFRTVPRHAFVNPADEAAAYEDRPLALSGGQTISQPYMVALMTQALDVSPGHRTLEVGTGSGYQAAILAQLGARVHTVERLPALSDEARRRLDRAGYSDIRYRVGDGTLGWPEEPEFDRIVVTAGAPDVPIGLLSRLGEGGILVVPIGDDRVQDLVRFRRGEGRVTRERLCRCSFVKLIGAEGWPEN
ncbi:MAG TPA: protein-L-isoaspartate(D-aspartate) O-methyltransferase [Planctomycetota bacterium]|nr:protein-L-isoaspartate(D-aspartate) O-methyltransferase [Planctomycetota bacterium]